MRCNSTEECFEEISTYFSGEKTGHFLLVNTESMSVYQEILRRLQADGSKKCVFVSQVCYPNGMPDIDGAIAKVTGDGQSAIVGLSQALMLRSISALEEKLDELLDRPISGYSVVLLDHCENALKEYLQKDIRLERRIIFASGATSQLPKIRLVKTVQECLGKEPLPDFEHMLGYLEHMDDNSSSEISVVTAFSPELFKKSGYAVVGSAGIYESLIGYYSDLAGATEQAYATNEQWSWLAEQMKQHSSLSSLICAEFGATINLASHLSDVMCSNDETRKWLLWLALKVFGDKSNHYLSYVLSGCNNINSFMENAYMALAEVDSDADDFSRLYTERKHLLGVLPERLTLTNQYCEKLGIYQKRGIYYLTDRTVHEKREFLRYLSIYDYSEKELNKAIKNMSQDLYLYMQDFEFDVVNTKLAESESKFRDELTEYFKQYKLQKLKNHISPDFLDKVNDYALSRPYNKLQPRSSIISHMEKENTQLFFFDALGVEYLAFILAKCKQYGLVSEVSIGHCELPSITVKNKEFLQYFSDENWCKIDELDEMKHHSQIYNYQKDPYPLHLFEELNVIDEELRKIQSMLVQGIISRAMIVSDHGASRLAVLYGKTSESAIELDEAGAHSGRCCPSTEDPKLPSMAYENGFAVLANYERFKGGRRANVEVHGGATLEETVVPIIILTKRPDEVKVCFIEPVIYLRPHVIPELTIYSNVPLQHPRLLFDGDFYEGSFVADKNHAKFSIPKIKRKGDYKADVYDGVQNLSITLEFKAQKQTREVDLF